MKVKSKNFSIFWSVYGTILLLNLTDFVYYNSNDKVMNSCSHTK